MTKLRKQETSIVSLAILFSASGIVASGAAAKPLASALMVNPILAKAASAITFPLPTNVPVGTSVRIGGSSGMETINQALKQRFEQQFVGTKIELNTQGTGPALKDLVDNNADLAAIGRTLLPQEKAQGLVSAPVSRHKIAIIVGSENPFKGGLTFEQFAKIFRGEIKDWAQIGGEPGPIRFIDRPSSSDTRQAFRNYSVFKQAPFATGKTAEQVGQDSTSRVVEALRTTGIGYAIADQLKGRGDVRVIPIDKTLPSDPKYPFSQPLIYVYKGPQPNLSAQAFLGYAAAPVSRKIIETARQEATAAIAVDSDIVVPSPKVTVPSPPAASSSVATPQPASPFPGADTGTAATAPWLWLLVLPFLGSLFWWLLKNRDAEPELEEELAEEMPVQATYPVPTVEPIPPAEPIVPVADVVAPLLREMQPVGGSRLTLVPRDCMNAYASWEIPAEAQASLQQQGAQKLVIRLYDVTGIDLSQQPPESLQEFDCDAQAHDRHLPIRTSDRDYLAELGYVADEGRWLQIARSESIHVPACPPEQTTIAPEIATLGGGVAPVSETVVAESAMLAEGSATPTVMAADRDDLATSADEGQVLPVFPKSTALHADDTALLNGWYSSPDATSLLFAYEAVDGGEAVHGVVRDRPLDACSELPEAVLSASHLTNRTGFDSSLPPTSQSQVVLIPRDAHDLYVYWEAIQAEKDALKQQGGQQMVLRVYAATGRDDPSPHNIQQYFCNDWDQDQHVSIPVNNLSYVAELGYTALDGRFLLLARSSQTWVPGA